MAVVAVVGCAAGGLEDLLDGLIRPLVELGHTVPVVVTPTAATWLKDIGQVAEFEHVTGLPVRSAPRLPREQTPHPVPDLLVAAPMTANSTAKLALGLADSQALNQPPPILLPCPFRSDGDPGQPSHVSAAE